MKLFRALCLAAALLGSSAGFVVQHRLSFPPAMRERSVGQLRKAAALSVEAPAADCLHEAGRRSRARSRVALYAMGSDMGAERDAVRNAEELKTGVKLRSPDMDKLCSWLTREITLWLDEDWIEREVHLLIGERAATSVRRIVNNGCHTAFRVIQFSIPPVGALVIMHHCLHRVPKYWPRSPFGVWPCPFLEVPKTRSENHSLALLSAFSTAIWGGMDTKVVVECLSVKANPRMITSHLTITQLVLQL